MFQVIKRRLKNQKGLTLVELLAVVVILGIIAAIAVPAIGNIIENSKIDAHNADIDMIQNAVQLYKAGTGSDPADVSALSPDYLKLKNTTSPCKSSVVYTEIAIDELENNKLDKDTDKCD